MFSSILINGLVRGGIYSMLAVGFSLVFGVARILNIAHTAFYMVAAFLAFTATTILCLASSLSVVIVIPITGIIGMLAYELCLDRVSEQETAVMIISLALALLLQEVFLLIFGAHMRTINSFVPGFTKIAGVKILYQDLFVIVASLIVLACVWLLLSKTRLGIAIRAVAQDREVANLMGIDVSRICLATMGISAALAGVAGAIATPMVEPFMWVHPFTVTLAAVLLGGLGSVKGSLIGAYILGLVESAVVFIIPSGSFLQGAFSLGVMVAVLLIRPEGLFGVVFEEERL